MPLSPLLALMVLPHAGRMGEEPTGPYAPRFELSAPLPTVPGVMIDTLTTGWGLAQETAKAKNLQARIMWVDATANLDRYNTEEKIVALVKQISEAGFNTIVFDVKPISGQVVYRSKLAPKLTEWRGKTMPADFDPLPIMVREGHAAGLQVFASLNAFSEGHRLFNVGPGYNRPLLQTVLYEAKPILRVGEANTPLVPGIDKLAATGVGVVSNVDRIPADGFGAVVRKDGLVLEVAARPVMAVPKGGALLATSAESLPWFQEHIHAGDRVAFDTEAEYVPIRERPEQQYPLMMNPFHPQVQQYALDIVREVVGNYQVDGVIYDDRLRFGGMNADFSEYTRARFEEKVGKKLTWPDDVFKWTLTPQMTKGLRPGPYYDAWMAFRAECLREFVQKVKYTVRGIRSTAQFGVYAGSWYGEYPALGHNYASPDAEAGFWFLSPSYLKTGTAPLLDFVIAGCYYPTPTIHEAMARNVGIGSTVEASGTLVNRMVRDQTWTYAGIALSDFKDDAPGLQAALQAACASTQGVMVFDLSHDIEPMWPAFAQAFAQPKKSPSAYLDILAEVRRRRKALDTLNGKKDPPVIIAAGSPGTGQ